MEQFNHTLNWIKGEINDALIFGILGICISIFSIYLFKTNAYSKSLAFPLLFVGLLLAIISVSNILVNQNRLKNYPELHQRDEANFFEMELERVQQFKSTYTYSAILIGICLVSGFFLFVFTSKSSFRAIGIAFILFGMIGAVIDYFSAERAEIYREQLLMKRTEADNS